MNRILASLLGVDQPDNSFLSGDYDVNRILQKPRSSIDTLMQPISEDPIYARNSGQITDPSGFGNVDPYNHAALDRLNQLYGQMPQRQEPNLGRRIVSSLAGMSAGGPATYYDGMALGFKNDPVTQAKVMDLYNYKPYYDQLDDFNQKAKLASDIAKFEQVDNENTRRYLYDQQRDRENDRRMDETERYNKERNRLQDEKQASEAAKREADIQRDRDKVEIARQRAEVYKFKAHNPNAIFQVDDQDRIIAIDPQTKQAVFVTDPDTGQPLKSSMLSEEEKANLDMKHIGAQGAQTRQNIAATGAEARKTEAVKEGNRQSDIAARGAQQRQTNSEKPVKSGSTKTQSIDQKLKAFKINHPEWVKYIAKDGTVNAPGKWGSSSPDQNTYNKITAAMKMEVTGVNFNDSGKSSKKTEADAAAYLRSKNRVVNDATIKAALAHQDEW